MNYYVYKFQKYDFGGNKLVCYEWDTLPKSENPFEYLKENKRDYMYILNTYNNEREKLTLSAIIPCKSSNQAQRMAYILNKSEIKED